MIKVIISFLSLFLLHNCSFQKEEKQSLDKENSSKDEIFIGKEFYAGDELSDYECIKNSSHFKSDSLCYSVYKPLHYHYFVFSLEKFLSNEDVEKFRILDTLHLKSIAHINFIHNELGASLFLDDKKIKEYLVTFYELIKPETLIENKKIEFWTLKQENYRELDLKIKYRDKEQALKIRNNLPNKIKERIEKHNSIIIDLETELKSSKTKAERKETIKNNIEMYEKAISELQDELRRYIVLKEIYPIFQNYIFQNYNEIVSEVENEK